MMICKSCKIKKILFCFECKKLNLFKNYSTNSNNRILKVEKEELVLQTTKESCPKCRNDTCFFYTKQMRAVDEPETQFYTCTKCKFKWKI